MVRHLVSLTFFTTVVLWSIEHAVAQQSSRQAERSRMEQLQRQQQRQPPQGPSVEDILRLFTPPESEAGQNDSYGERRSRSRATQRVVQPARPQVPTRAEVAGMTLAEQRKLLRGALQRLVDELDGMRVGEGWNEFLKLELLGSALWTGKGAQPDAKTRTTLAVVAAQFDTVANNPKFRAISGQWGFQAVNAAIGEYAMGPVQRSQRKVRNSSKQFDRSLQRLKPAPGWRKYLKANEVMRLAQSEEEMTSADEEILREIIRRYKEVSENEKYAKVARLHGFDQARRDLEELADGILQLKKPRSASNAALARQALETVALDVKALRKACQDQSKMENSMLKLAPGSREADEAEKVLRAIKEGHDKAMADAMERIEGLIKATLAENEVEYVLMQFEDVEEPVEVMLMQFSDVEEPEPEYVLMQFSDVEESGSKKKKKTKSKDKDQAEGNSRSKTSCHTQSRRSLAGVISILDTASDRPAGMTSEQSELLDRVLAEIKAGKRENTQENWEKFVKAVRKAKSSVDSSAAARYVIRESYAGELRELKNKADRLRHINQTKKLLRLHLTELREVASQLDAGSRVKIDSLDGLPIFRPGRRAYTIWQQKTFDREELREHIAELEEQLEHLGNDRQLANIDVQQLSQRLQQLLQMMSHLSKMLHDTEMNIVRKLG